MVYRIYSEKRPEFSEAAEGLAKDIREFLGIRTLEGVRIINRYDAEGVDEATFNACIETVFSEPQVDRTYTEAEFRAEICGNAAGAKVFAVEYLPGQFDQRADSAAQCISLVAQCERPAVRSAARIHAFGQSYIRRTEQDKGIHYQPRGFARSRA